jgi:hypothetical protein
MSLIPAIRLLDASSTHAAVTPKSAAKWKSLNYGS